jgi:RimJ/RimL family protein N-acetyltransferase
VTNRSPDTRLVPFDESHLAGFEAMLEDPDVLRFTRVPVPVPSGFPRVWLGAYEEGRRQGTSEAFAIVDGEGDGGEFLGIAVAPRIDRDGRTAELGYVVAPASRGQGVATRALQLLTDWAFGTLGALRAELIISVENQASKRVAGRGGYRREGVLRSTHFKQGIREDIEMWSRLPTDPD